MTGCDPRAIQRPDLLRAEYCPECGYMLIGLPPRGRCPECGFAYDESLVVLRGWACGARANGINSRRAGYSWFAWLNTYGRTVLWLGIVGTIAVSRLFEFVSGRFGLASVPSDIIRLGVLLVAAIAVIAWSIHRRRALTQEGVPPVQLCLFPAGFGQRDGAGPIGLHPWGRSDKPQLKRQRHGLYRIQCGRALRSFRLADDKALVDFEVKLDDQAAQRLQARIDAWDGAAQKAYLLERQLRKRRISAEEFVQQRTQIEADLQRKGLSRAEPSPLPGKNPDSISGDAKTG